MEVCFHTIECLKQVQPEVIVLPIGKKTHNNRYNAHAVIVENSRVQIQQMVSASRHIYMFQSHSSSGWSAFQLHSSNLRLYLLYLSSCLQNSFPLVLLQQQLLAAHSAIWLWPLSDLSLQRSWVSFSSPSLQHCLVFNSWSVLCFRIFLKNILFNQIPPITQKNCKFKYSVEFKQQIIKSYIFGWTTRITTILKKN